MKGKIKMLPLQLTASVSVQSCLWFNETQFICKWHLQDEKKFFSTASKGKNSILLWKCRLEDPDIAEENIFTKQL